MNTLIIDDEKAARENCKQLIAELHPDVTVCGEADNVESAYEQILVHSPDLILLDIDLPDGTAFDLLRRFPNIKFSIVFITAYEQFALQAIKFSALDYLLKPFTSGEFAEAMRKAREKKEHDELQLRLSALMQNMQPRNESIKMVLRTSDSIHVVNITDIIRLEADGAYTSFHFTNRKPIVVSKNLKEHETLLETNGFIRSHQSHLVNLQHVVCYHKADGGALGLTDMSRVPVATRFKDKVIRQLENI